MLPHMTSTLSALPTDASAFDSSISALKSCISVLESSIKSLDNSSAFCERLLPWFTGLVVVGLIVDVFVVHREHNEARREWSRGIVRPPDRPSTWKHVWELIATIAIFLGVAGELGVGVEIAVINGQLRSKNSDLRSKSDQLLALITQEAGDAVTSASKAQTLAKSASDIAGPAKATADAVSTEAAHLDGDLKDAKSQIAQVEAQRKALQEALENLAVCSAPRVARLAYVNGKSSVDSLRPFAAFQAIVEYVDDPETRRATSDIVMNLKAAGWTRFKLSAKDNLPDGVEVQPYIQSSPPGANRESEKAADALVTFLHGYNWQASLWDPPGADREIPPDGIRVEVGLYPPVTFVTPPAEKEVVAAGKEIEQHIDEMRKKRREEQLKGMSPQEAAQEKEDWARYDKEAAAMIAARLQQPCHPLSGLSY